MRGLLGVSVVSALLFCGQASAQARDWNQAKQIDVEVWNFKFDPEVLNLKAGHPYRLHLVNRSDSRHDFTAKAFFAAADVAPQDRAAIVKGGVDVPPNQSLDIRLVAPTAGAYEAHCGHFMHAHLGMKSDIVVR